MADDATRVTVECLSEYKDYTCNETHDIWALVEVTARAEKETEMKVPMDIVAVIDKSGSMEGEKLDLVKQTLEFVLTELNDNDRLALITYDSNVYIDFSLLNMTAWNKRIASSKISAVEVGDDTNLCGGLLSGMCELIDRTPEAWNDVATVLLFTDGLANRGIQNINGIVEAMKDPKRYSLPTKPPPGKKYINPKCSTYLCIKDRCVRPRSYTTSMIEQIFDFRKSVHQPYEDDSVPYEAEDVPTVSKSDATVYTFGFGPDHDASMLRNISDAGNGMYYFIRSKSMIGESFAHCLGALFTTVGQGIQLTITANQGVSIKAVHTTRTFQEVEVGKVVKIDIGDLRVEECRDIVLELRLHPTPGSSPSVPQTLITATVDYFNVNTNHLQSAIGSLRILRPTKETHHTEKNIEVRIAKEKNRIEVARTMSEASAKADDGLFLEAQQLLKSRLEALKLSKQHAGVSSLCNNTVDKAYDAMINDMIDYHSTVINERSWSDAENRPRAESINQAYFRERDNSGPQRRYTNDSGENAARRYTMYFETC